MEVIIIKRSFLNKMKKHFYLLFGIITSLIVVLTMAVSTMNSLADSHMRTPIDYRKSSETIPYPLSKVVHSKNFWIRVKISKSRAYLMNGNKRVYTMYCSAGKMVEKNGKKVSDTPTGTFHLQAEHGKTFYNASVKSGGNYYRSYHDHGSYLIHTVPIDGQGHYIKSEAKKLGKEPASHGCVRLSIPDAKWVYHNVPVGTKLVIEQ